VRTVGRFTLTLVLSAFGLALGVLLLARPAKAVLTAGEAKDVRSPLELQELSLRSVVTDRGGNVLAVLHADENRSPIPLEQVPPHVVNAILDVEDEAFWEHSGVNVRSILRAAFTNVRAGSVRQGGSTITQQLVKNTLLTPDRDINRKIKEAVLAVRLEDQMSKREILEHYLNTVYFGNGAYGVQAAAETYFGVRATELDVAQAAFLAGMIRNPVGYDPFRNPEGAGLRRNFALDRMVDSGHLSRGDADLLKFTPLPAARSNPLPTRDDYFVEEVKQRLLDNPKLGETPQERYNAVFRGGLRIETTFDPRLQTIAEESVERHIPDTKGQFVGALVSVDPASGAVRAMVAGQGFEQARYNLVTGRGGSGRQPGSSFKTFVLLAALENGFGPNDTIDGRTPCTFNVPGLPDGPYSPENYEGSKGAVGPLSEATANSLNCAYVRLGLALDKDGYKSLDKVADLARRLGIKGKIDSVPSMAIGSEEVTPLEMASAYAVIANDGVRHEPYFIERVLDRNGDVIDEADKDGERVLSQQTARVATSVLRKVVESGTGTKARLGNRPAAGKTGTSQEWRDAWFVGYTPQLATAVWMGAPVGQVEMRNVGGIRVTGGSYPAQTWGAYMREALKLERVAQFPGPDPRLIGKTKVIKDAYSKSSATTTRKSAVPPRRRPTARRPTTATTTAPRDDEPSTGSTSDGSSSPPGRAKKEDD
jgi:1A family penicillin-binding protein